MKRLGEMKYPLTNPAKTDVVWEKNIISNAN
jgi:hypothetical protein